MYKAIEFTAEVTPVPQNNARFGNGKMYQPKRVREYKKNLGLIARAKMRGRTPLSGKIKIEVTFAKNREIDSKTFGDIDNLQKSTFDAIKGVCFEDDAQIVEVHAVKVKSKNPCVKFKLEKANEGDIWQRDSLNLDMTANIFIKRYLDGIYEVLVSLNDYNETWLRKFDSKEDAKKYIAELVEELNAN